MGDIKEEEVADLNDMQTRNSLENDTSKGFEVEERLCAEEVMSKINELRRSDAGYCDLIVQVDGIDFPAHKIIFAGFSAFFEKRIRSDSGKSQQNTFQLTLTGMTAETFQSVLDFAYTSGITITDANADLLLRAAALIEAPHLSKICQEYLGTKINSHNYVKYSELASELSCSVLADLIKEYILKNFAEFSQQDEFLKLKMDVLIDTIKNDELEVPNEKLVLDAVMKWANHQKDRKNLLPKIFTYLRWAFISLGVLNEWIQENDEIRNSPDCMYWVSQVLLSRLQPRCKAEEQPFITKPRRSFSTNAVQQSIIGGDHIQVALVCRNSYSTGMYSDPLYTLDLEEGKLCPLKPLPDQGIKIQSVGLDGTNVYLNGWKTNERNVSSLYRHNLTSGCWDEVSHNVPFPLGLSRDFCVADGCLYATASEHERFQNIPSSFHRYDMKYKSLVRLADMPEGTNEPTGFCYHDNMIFAFGGREEQTVGGRVECVPSSSVCRYNTKVNQWSTLPSLLKGLEKVLCCQFDGKIYVLDGQQDNSEVTIMRPQVYDISMGEWNWGAPLNKAYRNPIALMVLNGQLIFVDKGGFPYLQIERLSFDKDSWELDEIEIEDEAIFNKENLHFFPGAVHVKPF